MQSKIDSKYEVTSVQRGGFLKIHRTDSAPDSGIYTCIVRNRAGEEGRREIEITVNSRLPLFGNVSLSLSLRVAFVMIRMNQHACINWKALLQQYLIHMRLTINFTITWLSGPPVIEAFSFPKNLQEGGRAQVTCAVSSGDMPIVFSWKKNDHSIPANLQVCLVVQQSVIMLDNFRQFIPYISCGFGFVQISVKGDEFFSMLVFKDISSKHNGRYTCFASNTAATMNFTSELLVRGESRKCICPFVECRNF